MDEIWAWGFRVGSGLLALFTLVYGILWLSRGGTAWLLAAGISLVGAAVLGYAARRGEG